MALALLILSTAVLAIAISAVYKYLLHTAILSPLANLPHAHWSCRFSSHWIDRHSNQETDNEATHQAHEKLGPIVRIGKNEVSVNHIDAVKEIYSGPCDRDSWYQFARNYGVENMFSYGDKASHTAHRRALGNVYAKSTLHSSQDIPQYAERLIKSRLLPFIQSSMAESGRVNVIPLFLAFATDFVSSYIFGSENTAEFLGREEQKLTGAASSEQSDRLVHGAREDSTGVALALMDRLEDSKDNNASTTGAGTEAVVHNRLSQNLIAKVPPTKKSLASPDLKLTIASELQDHIIAGTESSGWTVTYTLHELSKRTDLQTQLREDIRSIHELGMDSPSPFTPTTVQTLDKLPLLDAIVLETMRVHPGIAGSQPRVAPHRANGFTILGHMIPPDTVLSAQAYSLHRNADVFPSPEVWDPYRWIHADSDKRAEMQRWFWAFGSGPQLKLVVASIYANFQTQIINDDGIQQGGGYSAGPTGTEICFGFSQI
ncbi:Pyridoxine 4-dehydrogenase [Ascosphaera pollenicola]|nr:Pyridoxine 4-dehydrogenase [Ascosphaera pollenicola]